jgi:hypothetical protein
MDNGGSILYTGAHYLQCNLSSRAIESAKRTYEFVSYHFLADINISASRLASQTSPIR